MTFFRTPVFVRVLSLFERQLRIHALKPGRAAGSPMAKPAPSELKRQKAYVPYFVAERPRADIRQKRDETKRNARKTVLGTQEHVWRDTAFSNITGWT